MDIGREKKKYIISSSGVKKYIKAKIQHEHKKEQLVNKSSF
jgi:hypothetical protein